MLRVVNLCRAKAVSAMWIILSSPRGCQLQHEHRVPALASVHLRNFSAPKLFRVRSGCFQGTWTLLQPLLCSLGEKEGSWCLGTTPLPFHSCQVSAAQHFATVPPEVLLTGEEGQECYLL